MRVSVLRALAATSAKTRVSRRKRFVFREGKRYGRIRAGTCRPLDGEQLAGVLHGINAHECVEEREDRSNQPKPERYRRDDGESGEGSAAERAERVEDVACQVIDEGCAAGVATPVGNKRDGADSRQRPRTGVRGAQAIRDVSLRVIFAMERELFVELVFDAAGRHQCTHA